MQTTLTWETTVSVEVACLNASTIFSVWKPLWLPRPSSWSLRGPVGRAFVGLYLGRWCGFELVISKTGDRWGESRHTLWELKAHTETAGSFLLQGAQSQNSLVWSRLLSIDLRVCFDKPTISFSTFHQTCWRWLRRHQREDNEVQFIM